MVDGTAIKATQKAMWTSGDYAEVAQTIESAATSLLGQLEIGSGMELLDVACGTGNASLPAAQAGAKVTGLDLTPKLLLIAEQRAADAGVEISFVEGDAESLPFDAESFDRVVSVFGVMFAPAQQRGADELVRVARPGGRIGICAWTPGGLNGKMFAVMGAHMPPPPPDFSPPVLWGTEERVRELFAAHGLEPEFELRTTTFEADSIESWVGFHERTLGPVIMAKAALEPQGKWEAARADLVGLYEEANQAEGGAMRVEAEYLATTLQLPK